MPPGPPGSAPAVPCERDPGTPAPTNGVAAPLEELRRRAAEFAPAGNAAALDALFDAERNAQLVVNAEAYERSPLEGWNVRDRHMFDTLEALRAHLTRRDGRARIVVWAHNSHVHDARATELGAGGQITVGQLVRERYGAAAVLVGMTTHTGTVTAASDWDAPSEWKQVRPSLAGSHERVLHEAGIPSFLLVLCGNAALAGLREPRLERATGVVYLPESERQSHYFEARLADQFDAVLHFDATRALEALGAPR